MLCLSRHSSSQKAPLESEELPIGTEKLAQEENLSRSLQGKFFYPTEQQSHGQMSPKSTTLTSWQNHLRLKKKDFHHFLALASPHLSVSVSPSLVSLEGVLRLKDQKTFTKKEIMLLSPGAVALYDLKADSHNELPVSERWKEIWEQKRRKLDYDSDRVKSSRWQGFRDLWEAL